METKLLEVYSEAANIAVIRPAGRHFPGSVIQGDSLNILYRQAELILAGIRTGTIDTDLEGEAEDLRDKLLDRLKHYEATLEAHGIELPYAERVATLEAETAESFRVARIDDWIQARNARSFLDSIAPVFRSHFGALEWGSVDHGLRSSDAVEDRWFGYRIESSEEELSTVLELAEERTSRRVRVRAYIHFSCVAAVRQSISIFQRL